MDVRYYHGNVFGSSSPVIPLCCDIPNGMLLYCATRQMTLIDTTLLMVSTMQYHQNQTLSQAHSPNTFSIPLSIDPLIGWFQSFSPSSFFFLSYNSRSGWDTDHPFHSDRILHYPLDSSESRFSFNRWRLASACLHRTSFPLPPLYSRLLVSVSAKRSTLPPESRGPTLLPCPV